LGKYGDDDFVTSLAVVVKKWQTMCMGLDDKLCGVKEGAGGMFPGERRGVNAELTLDR